MSPHDINIYTYLSVSLQSNCVRLLARESVGSVGILALRSSYQREAVTTLPHLSPTLFSPISFPSPLLFIILSFFVVISFVVLKKELSNSIYNQNWNSSITFLKGLLPPTAMYIPQTYYITLSFLLFLVSLFFS